MADCFMGVHDAAGVHGDRAGAVVYKSVAVAYQFDMARCLQLTVLVHGFEVHLLLNLLERLWTTIVSTRQ